MKQRFFLQIPEVMRIRVDVRHLVGLIRGEQYVRACEERILPLFWCVPASVFIALGP